jgi:hypothetical protein
MAKSSSAAKTKARRGMARSDHPVLPGRQFTWLTRRKRQGADAEIQLAALSRALSAGDDGRGLGMQINSGHPMTSAVTEIWGRKRNGAAN